MSETAKIRKRISKYLTGTIYDIGCGDDKITPDAIGFDGRPIFSGGYLHTGLIEFPDQFKETADVVFSSHTLEHLRDDFAALEAWSELIKLGGLLILYLPDGRFYNNTKNLEHMRDYQYDQFMMFFRKAFCGEGIDFKHKPYPKVFEVVESGPDVGESRYSFYLVARKVGNAI